jgi:HK97 family phage prohead protease
MAIEIYDIDGTLELDGGVPNQPLVDYIRHDVEDESVRIFIVSARSIERLAETEKWLKDNEIPYSEIFLNDFGSTGPNVNEAFKAYKYSKLIEQYGLDEIAYLVDDDPEAREAAEGMGIKAYSPRELLDEEEDEEERAIVDVPDYIQTAATIGIQYYEDGLAGDGLVPETVSEARDLASGRVDDEKVVRMAAWIRRHRGDWESVDRNNNPDHEDFPGPGAVAAYLWGVNPTAPDGADRVLLWADRITTASRAMEFDVKEIETRSTPIGVFSIEESDGQKTFSGYAAIFGSQSAGLGFNEVIAPGAFKRTLSRAERGERTVKFLHGHDESRMLASTASGRLTLKEDEIGLRVEAKLDPADPDAAAVISKLSNEAAAMGMSFGFTVPKNGDSWNGETRTLKEINLFEVSILSGHTPAYPATLGLTAVRKVAEPKLGIDAERLISTLEAVKAGKDLTDDEAEVIEQVRTKLGPKRGIDPSVAAATVLLERLRNEEF